MIGGNVPYDRVDVDQGEDAMLWPVASTSCMKSIAQRSCSAPTAARCCRRVAGAPPTLAPLELQRLLLVEATHLLEVDQQPVATKQHVDPLRAEGRAILRQLVQATLHRRIIRRLGAIANRRSMHDQRATGAPDVTRKPCCARPPPGNVERIFFPRAFRRMVLASVRSATA